MKTYNRKHYQENKGYYVEKARRHSDKILTFIREAKSDPCADCGVKYDYWVMDFDHLHDKDFNIASSVKSLAAIKIEIAKCEVVCSNCHRERSHRRYTTRRSLMDKAQASEA